MKGFTGLKKMQRQRKGCVVWQFLLILSNYAANDYRCSSTRHVGRACSPLLGARAVAPGERAPWCCSACELLLRASSSRGEQHLGLPDAAAHAGQQLARRATPRPARPLANTSACQRRPLARSNSSRSRGATARCHRYARQLDLAKRAATNTLAWPTPLARGNSSRRDQLESAERLE